MLGNVDNVWRLILKKKQCGNAAAALLSESQNIPNNFFRRCQQTLHPLCTWLRVHKASTLTVISIPVSTYVSNKELSP